MQAPCLIAQSSALINLMLISSTLLTLSVLSLMVASQRTQFSEIVNTINESHVSWTAGLAADINYDDPASLQNRLGTLVSLNNAALQQEEIKEASEMDTPVADSPVGRRRPRQLQTVSVYPESLDLRSSSPKCSSIALIRNQKNCGSCWAFATMNALSDRYCIAKSTATNIRQKFFSVQDSLECCTACNGGSGNGCRGGIPYIAIKYAVDKGITSGELRSFSPLCKPYYLDYIFDHSMTAPSCRQNCTNPNGFPLPYANHKFKPTGIVFGRGEQQMIAALNNGGSISAAFFVYEDFYAYKLGIYTYKTGRILGGHAVRVIGYGIEGGVKFWLCANSWGAFWGEAGFFRIRRGANECGIEANYFTSATF